MSDNGLRVALIYKRQAQPDEHLLTLLEKHLAEAGHRVFIDRHMKIGDEWEKQITYELKNADAVVILLSPMSIYSEMLAYEVDIAHKTALERGGRPKLFPVRINFEDPLPQELANKLAPLQYALWRDSDDDMPLVCELLDRLPHPPVPLEMIGGAVPLDSKFYVVRQVDEDFQTALSRRDAVVLLKGGRQVGKTSLLARGLQKARDAGVQVLLTDFQRFIDSQLETLESFFLLWERCSQISSEQMFIPGTLGKRIVLRISTLKIIFVSIFLAILRSLCCGQWTRRTGCFIAVSEARYLPCSGPGTMSVC